MTEAATALPASAARAPVVTGVFSNPAVHEAAVFTAARIAAAAGISQRAVYKHFEGLKSGVTVKNGKTVNAWPVHLFPDSLRSQLREIAERRGYRSDIGLLLDPPKPWNPPALLSAYSDRQLARASNLRQAFTRTLNELNISDIQESEAERRGVEDFARVHGYSISGRHWRRLLKRTLERDAGAEDWTRLELYVDERPEPKPTVTDAPVTPQVFELRERLAHYREGEMPEKRMREFLWVDACTQYDELVECGMKDKEARKEVLRFLVEEAPFMGRTADSIRVVFVSKLRQWEQGGGKPSAIKDKRPAASGHFRAPKLTPEDHAKLVAAANEFGGGISQAFRELLGKGQLSPDISAYYRVRWNIKSYVPIRIREAVTHDVRIAKPWIRGKHAAKMAGAYTSRDPSAMNSGDWFSADDLTSPVYYYEEENPHQVLRGQTLIMNDFRSHLVLGFVVIPFPQYTAFDIRNLVTVVHDTVGLPRKGFYFERGIWKTSRLIVGRRDDFQWEDTEKGLREFALFKEAEPNDKDDTEHGLREFSQLRNAKEARAKTVERILGIIQNTMGRHPGYAGRDERRDSYEGINEKIKSVRSIKYHAGEFFLSKTEWVNRLEVIIEEYNGEIQNGKYLPGISPAVGFQNFFGAVPLTHLPEDCRFILANHKIPVKVGRNGIGFRFGKQAFSYKGAQTGGLVGRDVLVWFNPSSPETVSVTDLDRRYLCTVPRVFDIPAMGASREELEYAERLNAEHNAYAKRVFKTIKPHLFSDNFRGRMFKPCLVDGTTRTLGAKMAEDREALTEETQETARMDRRSRNLARHLNMARPPTPSIVSQDVLRDQIRGMEKLKELFEDVQPVGAAENMEALS